MAGRYFGPARLQFIGDPSESKKHIGLARTQMGIMLEFMGRHKLTNYRLRRRYPHVFIETLAIFPHIREIIITTVVQVGEEKKRFEHAFVYNFTGGDEEVLFREPLEGFLWLKPEDEYNGYFPEPLEYSSIRTWVGADIVLTNDTRIFSQGYKLCTLPTGPVFSEILIATYVNDFLKMLVIEDGEYVCYSKRFLQGTDTGNELYDEDTAPLGWKKSSINAVASDQWGKTTYNRNGNRAMRSTVLLSGSREEEIIINFSPTTTYLEALRERQDFDDSEIEQTYTYSIITNYDDNAFPQTTTRAGTLTQPKASYTKESFRCFYRNSWYSIKHRTTFESSGQAGGFLTVDRESFEDAPTIYNGYYDSYTTFTNGFDLVIENEFEEEVLIFNDVNYIEYSRHAIDEIVDGDQDDIVEANVIEWTPITSGEPEATFTGAKWKITPEWGTLEILRPPTGTRIIQQPIVYDESSGDISVTSDLVYQVYRLDGTKIFEKEYTAVSYLKSHEEYPQSWNPSPGLDPGAPAGCFSETVYVAVFSKPSSVFVFGQEINCNGGGSRTSQLQTPTNSPERSFITIPGDIKIVDFAELPNGDVSFVLLDSFEPAATRYVAYVIALNSEGAEEVKTYIPGYDNSSFGGIDVV